MKYIFTLSLIIFSLYVLSSQVEEKIIISENTFLDSLQYISSDKDKIAYFTQSHTNFSNHFIDSMVVVFQPNSQRKELSESMGNLYFALATSKIRQGDLESFFQLNKEAKNLFEKSDNTNKKHRALGGIAYYYFITGQKDKAKEIYDQLLVFFQAEKIYPEVAKVYMNYTNLYMYPLSLKKLKAANDSMKVYLNKSKKRNPILLYNYFGNELIYQNKTNNPKKVIALVDSVKSFLPELNDYYKASGFARIASELIYITPYKAMKYFIKADSFYQIMNNTHESQDMRRYIGLISSNIGDYQTARKYYEESLLEFSMNKKSTFYIKALFNILLLDLDEGVGDIDENISLTDTILKHLEPTDDFLRMDAYMVKSRFYYRDKDIEKTKIYLDKIFAYNQHNKEKYHNFFVYHLKVELLINKGDTRQVRTYNNLAKEMIVEDTEMKMWLKQRIDIMDNLNIPSETIQLQNKYIALVDSMSMGKTKMSIKSIEEKYENDLKQNEIEQLELKDTIAQEKLSSTKKSILGVSIGLGLLGLLSFSLFRQNNLKKKANTTLNTQKEKIEFLYHEMNHRVKNNLAFMTSLLEMQGRRTDEKEAIKVIKESEFRLKTLSILHDKLFDNDNDSEIDISEYIDEIIDYIQAALNIPNKELVINTNFEHYDIDPENAMRVGLIVNELITNSLKHAFHEVDSPRIDISIEKTKNKFILQYKDNGPGFNLSIVRDKDRKTKNMGARLISMLVLQLEAEIKESIIENEVEFSFVA